MTFSLGISLCSFHSLTLMKMSSVRVLGDDPGGETCFQARKIVGKKGNIIRKVTNEHAVLVLCSSSYAHVAWAQRFYYPYYAQPIPRCVSDNNKTLSIFAKMLKLFPFFSNHRFQHNDNNLGSTTDRARGANEERVDPR